MFRDFAGGGDRLGKHRGLVGDFRRRDLVQISRRQGDKIGVHSKPTEKGVSFRGSWCARLPPMKPPVRRRPRQGLHRLFVYITGKEGDREGGAPPSPDGKLLLGAGACRARNLLPPSTAK